MLLRSYASVHHCPCTRPEAQGIDGCRLLGNSHDSFNSLIALIFLVTSNFNSLNVAPPIKIEVEGHEILEL